MGEQEPPLPHQHPHHDHLQHQSGGEQLERIVVDGGGDEDAASTAAQSTAIAADASGAPPPPRFAVWRPRYPYLERLRRFLLSPAFQLAVQLCAGSLLVSLFTFVE